MFHLLASIPDETYYVGSTGNLAERLERHNQGRSKYTKAKRPWSLEYSEEYQDRSAAVTREQEIKARKKAEFIKKLVSTSRP